MRCEYQNESQCREIGDVTCNVTFIHIKIHIAVVCKRTIWKEKDNLTSIDKWVLHDALWSKASIIISISESSFKWAEANAQLPISSEISSDLMVELYLMTMCVSTDISANDNTDTSCCVAGHLTVSVSIIYSLMYIWLKGQIHCELRNSTLNKRINEPSANMKRKEIPNNQLVHWQQLIITR